MFIGKTFGNNSAPQPPTHPYFVPFGADECRKNKKIYM